MHSGKVPRIAGLTNAHGDACRALNGAAFFREQIGDDEFPSPSAREAMMGFTTKQIARAVRLGDAAIRQWLARAPGFSIGTVVGRARVYDLSEAIAVMVAAEILRHGLARPHEALPAARDAPMGASGTLWAYRDHDDELAISSERPTAAVAVSIPLAELRRRLVKH
jgi:hypothetical protein